MAEFEQECRTCFTLFDQDRDGKVQATQLGSMLRMLGQVWSCASIAELERKATGGYITLPAFLRTAKEKRTAEARSRKKPLNEAMLRKYCIRSDIGLFQEELDELKACFDVFDRAGRGLCAVKDITNVLICLGEQLSEKDVQKLFALHNLEGATYLRFADFCELFARLRD
eukprot:XP_023973889.1 calmodulin-like [Physeter catodon]